MGVGAGGAGRRRGGHEWRVDAGVRRRHPGYTFVNAAEALTHYIDAHPNGKRLLVSNSGEPTLEAKKMA